MRPARAFRIIWRINAALILLALLAILGLGVAGAVTSVSWGRRTARAPAAVVAEQGERLFIGSAREVEGTPFVILPLETHRSVSKLSSGPSYETETRNLLFFDSNSGTSRWLRPDNATAILGYQLLRQSGAIQAKWDTRTAAIDPVRWIRYKLAPATAGRDAATREGVRQVAVSGPGGEGFTVVLDEVDEVLGYAPARNGTLVAFVRQGQNILAAGIDLGARKVQRTLPISKP